MPPCTLIFSSASSSLMFHRSGLTVQMLLQRSKDILSRFLINIKLVSKSSKGGVYVFLRLVVAFHGIVKLVSLNNPRYLVAWTFKTLRCQLCRHHSSAFRRSLIVTPVGGEDLFVR